VSEADLRKAIAASLGILIALCAARVATDGAQGHASLEGALALVLFALFTRRLALDAIRTRRRHETLPPGDTPYRSAMPRSIVADS
jgi:hypothetical protein